MKAYAEDRNLDIPHALGELVAAGLETKNDTALKASYRAFEGMNQVVYEKWEGVSREANDLLGPPPAIETKNGEVWTPESDEKD